MTRAAPEPVQYFRHSQKPAWGVAVLVRDTGDQRTYLFADGNSRTFKTALAVKFIEQAAAPAAEDRVRLERGIGSAAAQGPTSAISRPTNATPKAVNLELEAQIREARGEPGSYLVYADWLQSRGDPRGELIVAQHQLSLDPENKKLRATQDQLLATHDAYFLPKQASQLMSARRKPEEGATSALIWRYGFIDRVHLARRNTRPPELEPALAELLAHPSAQFLRAITLGALGDADSYSYVPLIAVIVKARPALVEELVIGAFTSAQMELAFTRLGNAATLFRALPELRRLVLRSGTLRFESSIKHDRLAHLAITATEVSEDNVERLAASSLPALATLEVSARDLEISNADVLDRLLRPATFPALRRLALDRTIKTPQLLESILRSRLIEQLEELALRDGSLGDPAVIQLVQHAARWRHLRVLDLGGNRISAAAFAKLDGIGHVIGEQRLAVLAADVVLARAPDARSALAARELAHPEQWLALGRDGDRLWGEYDGRSGQYWVFARLPSLETGCTCPSTKDPCKHALALLLLEAERHPFVDRPVPASFRVQTERPRYRSTWE